MKQKVTRIHPADNVLVALTDLRAGEQVKYQNTDYKVLEFIPAKHKFAINEIPEAAI